MKKVALGGKDELILDESVPKVVNDDILVSLDNHNTFDCPVDEEIRRKAYFLWEEAGCPDGRSVEFWLMAENSCEVVS